MAKNTAAQSSITWINYDLTKQDKARLAEYFADENALEAGLQALTREGYKIHVAYDNWAECFAAYVFPGASNGINKGMALAARSRTCVGALSGAVFRHFVVFSGNWRVPDSKVAIDD